MVYNPHFDDPSIQQYFDQIGRYPLLTKEREYELARDIRENNNPKALESLVNSNLRFVVSVAKRYLHQGLTLQDLIQEGNTGLIKAAERFDERRDFRFISYAVWWIRQAILKAIAEQKREVRLPQNVNQLYTHMDRFWKKYELENCCPPPDEVMISNFLFHLQEPKEALRLYYQHREGTLSLDEAQYPDSIKETTRHEFIESEQLSPLEVVEQGAVSDAIYEELASRLDIREVDVILMYYYDDLTLEQIGTEIGVTRERVRQIRNQALEKLGYSKKLKQLN